MADEVSIILDNRGNNDYASYGSVYGALYNWYAVNNAHGLAPTGWRVPSDTDWATLITYLGGGLVAGGTLKEIGLDHWAVPNAGATDGYGFKALPGGLRAEDGVFYVMTTAGYWWTSSEFSALVAWYINMGYLNSTINTLNVFNKKRGYSIRCMRDI